MLAVKSRADPRLLAVMVVGGACLIYRLPFAPPLWVFIAPLLFGLMRWPGRAAWVAFVLAAAWTAYQAHQQLATRLPAGQSGAERWVEGRVDGLVTRRARRIRFVLQRDTTPRRLRLSWYDDAPPLLPGDCLRLKVKLDAPHGSANPGTFDYEAWLWRKRIDATGYVKAAGQCDAPPAASVDRLRALALRRLDRILSGQPMRGILEALTLGARNGISDRQWDVLRATGTSHLVAISGLHIGLMATLLFGLARWIALRLPGRWPVQTVAAVTAFAGAMFYAALAGLALPTQRALIMVAAGLLVAARMRDIAPSRMLAIAAIAVVGWQPASVIAPGFWLSFGAVAWLLFLAHLARGRKLAGFGLLQVGLVTGLAPLTLWFFEQASLVAPLVNALLIPAAVFVVPALLALTLLALLWPVAGAPLLVGAAQCLAAAWPGLAVIAEWPLASLHVAAPGLPALGLAMAGVALLLMPRGLPGRWAGLLLIMPALFGWRLPGSAIPEGSYRLTVLDVGQGLSVVVRTHRHTLVFDAGPAYRTGFDAGDALVVPYLRHVGRSAIDRLVISHADIDHRGGAPALERELDVGLRLGARSAHRCEAGERWRWDAVDFAFVYPNPADRAVAGNRNDRSCVLRIEGPGGSALLTGDIEVSAERRLLARDAAAVDVDILVVAHHGSASSSSSAFLAAVSPGFALISSGWRNRWGFPALDVRDRLAHTPALIANTADSGALTARVPSDPRRDIALHAWRHRHDRLWRLP